MEKKGSSSNKQGYYIQPSFSKTVITQAGNICDFAGANNLGLWDGVTMKNINLITGIPFQDSQYYVKPLPGGNGNRVVMFSADKFQILDLDNHTNPLIWEKIQSTDDIQQIAVNMNNEREIYVLMTSGYLNVWDIVDKKIIQEFQTIRKMYRRVQVFPDGKQFALQEKQGYEINIIERSTGLESKLSFKSPASRFIILNETDIAIVFKNLIQIRSTYYGVNDIVATLLCEDPDEVFESVALLNNNKWIAAAGEKGIIRIWDVQSQKLKFQFDSNLFNSSKSLSKLTHIHSILYLPNQHQLAVLNSEERHFRLFALGNFESAEFSKDFLHYKDWQTCINNYELAFSINGKNLVGLLSVKGTFVEDEVTFTKEIEILDLDKNQIIASKDLSLQNFSLNQKSMRCNGKNKVFYLMKNQLTQESVFIHFDVEKFLELPVEKRKDVEGHRSYYETAYTYQVQDNGKNSIFPPISDSVNLVERIIVPFHINQQQDYGFNVIPFEETSGIAVYDFQMKQLWMHKFINKDNYQVAKHCVMIDENTIAFVNKQNIIEIWDIVENKNITNHELEGVNVAQFLFSNNQFFVLDNKNKAHFYKDIEMFDAINQIQLKSLDVKSIQNADDDNYLVQYFDESIQKINFDEGKINPPLQKRSFSHFIVLPQADKSKKEPQEPYVLLLNEEYLQILPFNQI